MQAREKIIKIGDEFEGTIKEAKERYGVSEQYIYKCLYEERKFRGKKVAAVGYVHHRMVYGLYENGELYDQGTAVELADKYYASESCFPSNACTGFKFMGIYDVKRIGYEKQFDYEGDRQ